MPLIGLVGGLGLLALAMVVPAVTHWKVNALGLSPFNGEWAPRVGPGTVPAVVLAALASWRAIDLAHRLAWRRLLLASFGAALLWLLALALVDGTAGLGHILERGSEYLGTARHLDVPAALHDWVRRTNAVAGQGRWVTHVAGHPPGATLFFWLLVRLGLGSATAAGLVVTVIAATTPVAALVTLRRLGAEPVARRVAPFLVFGPAAIWSAVSADAVFAAVAAWALAALAAAASGSSRGGRVAWSVLAGLLFGMVAMLSYGLLLLAVLAFTVLWLGRDWRPLPVVALAAAVVIAGFAAYGFAYWEALPAIRERYWAGIASARPGGYWAWADLAVLVGSAGPLVGAGVAVVVSRARGLVAEPATRVAAALSLAAVVTVIAADASQMSRAEVERIWLPFVPWLLVSVALLPPRWRRWGLVGQVVAALLVQHLVRSPW